MISLEKIKQRAEIIISWVVPIMGAGIAIGKIFFNIPTDILLAVFLGLFSFDAILLNLSKKNDKEVLDLLIEKTNIDNIFTSDNDKEDDIIKNANSELCILQETGSKIMEDYNVDIVNFLAHAGFLKIVICSNEEVVISQLLFRNYNLDTHDAMQGRFNNFMKHIDNFTMNLDGNQILNKIIVRYCPYPLPITAVIDNSRRKRAVIRWADFKLAYKEKNDLYIVEKYNQKLYDYYLHQFQKYYCHSYKIVLLTGAPRIGKTHLFRNLVQEKYNNFEDVFYMYSEEILNTNNERIGFNAIISKQSQYIKQFAEKKDNGEYEPNIEVLDEIAEHINNNKNKIMILDEIGLIQLKSNKFADTIKNIFSNTTTTLFATISKEDDVRHLISSFKNNPRSYCINYNDRRQENNIMTELITEIDASLNLYKTLNKREVK